MKGLFTYNVVYPTSVLNFDPIASLRGELLYSDNDEVYSIKEKEPFTEDEVKTFLLAGFNGNLTETWFCNEIRKTKFKKYDNERLLFLASVFALQFSFTKQYSDEVLSVNLDNGLFNQDLNTTFSIGSLSNEPVSIPITKISSKISYSAVIQQKTKFKEPKQFYIDKIIAIFYGNSTIQFYKGTKGIQPNNIDKTQKGTENQLDTEVLFTTFDIGWEDGSENPFSKKSYQSLLKVEQAKGSGGFGDLEAKLKFLNLNHYYKPHSINKEPGTLSVSVSPVYKFFTKERESEVFGGTRGERQENSYSNLYIDEKLFKEVSKNKTPSDSKSISGPTKFYMEYFDFNIINLESKAEQYPSFFKCSYQIEEYKANIFKNKNEVNELLLFSKDLYHNFIKGYFFNESDVGKTVKTFEEIQIKPFLQTQNEQIEFINKFKFVYDNNSDSTYLKFVFNFLFKKDANKFQSFLLSVNKYFDETISAAEKNLIKLDLFIFLDILSLDIAENYYPMKIPKLDKSFDFIVMNKDIMPSNDGDAMENYYLLFAKKLNEYFKNYTTKSVSQNIGEYVIVENLVSAQKQVYYLKAANNLNFLDLFDTQVLYGENYKVRFGFINLVSGFSYEYEYIENKKEKNIIKTTGIGNVYELFSFDYKQTTVPYLMTYSQECFKDFTLFEEIPTKPDVDIAHYKNTNTIRVFFQPSAQTSPILKSSYVEQFQTIQNLVPQDEIHYTENDLDDFFLSKKNAGVDIKEVIFRYEHDIKNHYCVLLDEKLNVIKIMKDKSALKFCLDENTKYFALFFSQDLHNKISLPEVYSIKIFNSDSLVYTDIKNIEYDAVFGEKAKKKLKYSFKHKLSFSIKDEFISGNSINYDTIKNLDDTKFNIWNMEETGVSTDPENYFIPKFKLRIKSKKTGKKIDLNIKLEKGTATYDKDIDQALKDQLADSWNLEKLTI